MAQKHVILLVDNRNEQEEATERVKAFKGSGFKSTEVDPSEDRDIISRPTLRYEFLSQLQEKVASLEQRVCGLEEKYRQGKLSRRNRRKAFQIKRQYKCGYPQCQKLYGSETSLKNHLKIKHKKADEIV